MFFGRCSSRPEGAGRERETPNSITAGKRWRFFGPRIDLLKYLTNSTHSEPITMRGQHFRETKPVVNGWTCANISHHSSLNGCPTDAVKEYGGDHQHHPAATTAAAFIHPQRIDEKRWGSVSFSPSAPAATPKLTMLSHMLYIN